MKTIAYVLGALLIVLAIVYFLVPADALPSFLPGYDATMPRVRTKHGLASGAVGIVLMAIGWWVGRARV
jgi:hypothetical protein